MDDRSLSRKRTMISFVVCRCLWLLVLVKCVDGYLRSVVLRPRWHKNVIARRSDEGLGGVLNESLFETTNEEDESLFETTKEEEEDVLLTAPGPRELFANSISKPVGVPGTLKEAEKQDYEEWISRQLRLNRIQACSDIAKEDLVEKMRRIDYDEDLAEELQRLVLTGNGVTDKSTSSLLIGHWDEVYPNDGAVRKCLFEVSEKSGVRFQREREVLGPLLTVIRRYEARKLDDRTLSLTRPRFGGLKLKFFGFFMLPLLRISKKKADRGIFASSSSSAMVDALDFKYVDSDLVVLDLPFPTSHLVVLAPPRENSFFFSLLFAARRLQAFRQRRKLRSSAKQDSPENDEAQPALPIGDLIWKADTSMEVDDDAMQKFLEKPSPYRSRLSIQDMLDGKLRLDDFSESKIDARLAKLYGASPPDLSSASFGLRRVDDNDNLKIDFPTNKKSNPIGLTNQNNRQAPPPANNKKKQQP